jgi:hypothetical protein
LISKSRVETSGASADHRVSQHSNGGEYVNQPKQPGRVEARVSHNRQRPTTNTVRILLFPGISLAELPSLAIDLIMCMRRIKVYDRCGHTKTGRLKYCSNSRLSHGRRRRCRNAEDHYIVRHSVCSLLCRMRRWVSWGHRRHK